MVRATHHFFLGRDADPSWLTAFVEELGRRAATQSLTDVVTDFRKIIYTSPEAQARLRASLGRRGIEPIITPGLAARPSPLSCIVDDFAPLLISSEDEPIPAKERPEGSQGHLCRHRRYGELYGETIFHLHDPSGALGHAALEGAVLRLRDAMRGLHGKMLMQVTDETDASLAVFEETCDMLDRLARGAHRCIRCHTLSRPQGIGFGDMMDEVVLLRGALAAPQITSM